MTTIRTFLAKKIYESELIFIDRWSILHVALFFGIGIYYPNRWMLVIMGMIVFEYIEAVVSKSQTFLKETLKDTTSDLLFNVIGYWAGMRFIGAI